MRLGRADVRTERPLERARMFVVHVLGQGRLLQDPYSGLMHAMIFWGFLVITVMTADMLVTGVIPGLSLPWIERNPVFLVSLDTFEALVLVGIAMAFARRLIWRPRR